MLICTSSLRFNDGWGRGFDFIYALQEALGGNAGLMAQQIATSTEDNEVVTGSVAMLLPCLMSPLIR